MGYDSINGVLGDKSCKQGNNLRSPYWINKTDYYWHPQRVVYGDR